MRHLAGQGSDARCVFWLYPGKMRRNLGRSCRQYFGVSNPRSSQRFLWGWAVIWSIFASQLLPPSCLFLVPSTCQTATKRSTRSRAQGNIAIRIGSRDRSCIPVEFRRIRSAQSRSSHIVLKGASAQIVVVPTLRQRKLISASAALVRGCYMRLTPIRMRSKGLRQGSSLTP